MRTHILIRLLFLCIIILKSIKASGAFISKFGSRGSGNGQFIEPHRIHIDTTRIFVTDLYNHRIQVFNPSGVYLKRFGKEGSGNGEFLYPADVHMHNGRLYVIDTFNHRVQVFDQTYRYISHFGRQGNNNGQFSYPSGIHISANKIYVVDTFNHRIQVFGLSGNYISQFGNKGSSNGQFNSPSSVFVQSNRIYVVDRMNQRIQIFDTSYRYLSKFGSKGSNNANFLYPTDIFVDSHMIYIADSFNNRIQIFDKSGNYMTQIGSKGSNNGQFLYPDGITLNRERRIYVADAFNSRIQVFSAVAVPTTPTPTPTPKKSINLMNGINSGGNAKVVYIGGAPPYNSDLSANGCSGSWRPQGTLCDRAAKHSKAFCDDRAYGATWRNSGTRIGIIIVDLGSWKYFNELRVFQMFSDGRTTHIRFARSRYSSYRSPNDSGWSYFLGSSFRLIGKGKRQGGLVGDPTVYRFGTQRSRYLKIEAKNDGRYGSPSYIELRSVKMFYN